METRTEFKERLQNAGVWQEFVQIRDQLKSEGMDAESAKQEALSRVEPKMAAPNTDEAAELVDDDCGLDFSKTAPHDVTVRWVAANLANAKVEPRNAPDGIAWAMLLWARKPSNQSQFWQTQYTRVAQKSETSDPAPSEPQAWDGNGPCPTCKREPLDPETVAARERGMRWLREHGDE